MVRLVPLSAGRARPLEPTPGRAPEPPTAPEASARGVRTSCGAVQHRQRRRIELDRIAATSPRVALLDEPFSGLTRADSRLLQDQIARLVRAGWRS